LENMDDGDSDHKITKRSKVIHYGSLEEKERQKLKGLGPGISGLDAPSSSAPTTEVRKLVDLEDESVNRMRAQMIEEIERKRKSRQIVVSVDDVEVRAHLRDLNEPMCLFGEGPADRRERLRQLLSKLGQDAVRRKKEEEHTDRDKGQNETWYHEGGENLRLARLAIAEYSVRRAMQRLAIARAEKEKPLPQRTAMKSELYKNLRTWEISCSQVADSRPVSSCKLSPDSSLIATSSWSGSCRLWSVPDLKSVINFRPHNCQAAAIVFHPESTVSQSETSLNLASSGFDGSVYLWSLKDTEPLASLDGHDQRVSRLAFHPSGRFLATACYDKSWRLWDLESQEEILFQEGHNREVFDVCFQSDGSLAATGGLDAFGRVWDLRTGRCIMFLEGHLKGILSIDFSPNGYQIATGSEDNTVKVWDVRMRKLEYTIPAHTNIVSRVMFDKHGGHHLASASYDAEIKLWASPAWTPIHALAGHDNKIMGLDLSIDNKLMISSSYDRTFKLWSQESATGSSEI
jgi:U4/U6 small nuclear ribonucleoprotein PRP4